MHACCIKKWVRANTKVTTQQRNNTQMAERGSTTTTQDLLACVRACRRVRGRIVAGCAAAAPTVAVDGKHTCRRNVLSLAAPTKKLSLAGFSGVQSRPPSLAGWFRARHDTANTRAQAVAADGLVKSPLEATSRTWIPLTPSHSINHFATDGRTHTHACTHAHTHTNTHTNTHAYAPAAVAVVGRIEPIGCARTECPLKWSSTCSGKARLSVSAIARPAADDDDAADDVAVAVLPARSSTSSPSRLSPSRTSSKLLRSTYLNERITEGRKEASNGSLKPPTLLARHGGEVR